MRIGVYGGTFNPPHLGHISSARYAMETLGLDRLLFIPAGDPPHKALPPLSPAAGERLGMTELAADAMLLPGRAEVSDLEILREGKSYTADTLAELHEQYPDDELWLLMGSDMFLTLQEWKKPEVICRLARLAAFARTREDSAERLEAQGRYLRETYGAKCAVLQLSQLIPVSSTRLRELLARGEGREYLSPAVYGYILRKGLYGTHADLKGLEREELTACSLSMVHAKRHAHILGVADTAVELADRWGADREPAFRAGILHDCTKYLPLAEHLDICERYGIEPDGMERESAKLLHAKTGAALARHIYGQSDEVYRAIYWHTTGKADMTRLEKILYLADFIEPNRKFDGVEQLRRLCHEDLEEALLLGVRMSVADLNERRVPIHKNTQAAMDWVLEHRKG